MRENHSLSQSRKSELRERFHEPDENYNLLHGDSQAVRGRAGVWDTDYVLEKYVQSTDKIIGELDGSIAAREILDSEDPERSATKPDTVVWLDKSARPVSWFVDAFWEQYAKPGVERPDDEFLNIDRENWFVRQGHNRIDAGTRLGPNDFDITKVPDEDIARIRALFTVGEIDKDDWQRSVWELPTRLDGQNILVIDEVKNKGGTLKIATELIRRAVPSAVVSGDYFWRAGTYALDSKGHEMQMESAPVWYDADDEYGRGVGEISKSYWKHEYDTNPTEENYKRLLGWMAISAPHYDIETFEQLDDFKAKKLLQDIAYLTYGRTLRKPAKDRPVPEIREIIEDQGLTIKEFAAFSDARSKQNIPPKVGYSGSRRSR